MESYKPVFALLPRHLWKLKIRHVDEPFHYHVNAEEPEILQIAPASCEYVLFGQEHLCKPNKHIVTNGFIQLFEKK